MLERKKKLMLNVSAQVREIVMLFLKGSYHYDHFLEDFGLIVCPNCGGINFKEETTTEEDAIVCPDCD